MNKDEIFELFFHKFMGLKCANPKDEFREAFNEFVAPHLKPDKDEIEFDEWWNKTPVIRLVDLKGKENMKAGWMAARGRK